MILVFFRENGFYPLDMPDDVIKAKGLSVVVEDNARLNPGTLRIEDAYGHELWPKPEPVFELAD